MQLNHWTAQFKELNSTICQLNFLTITFISFCVCVCCIYVNMNVCGGQEQLLGINSSFIPYGPGDWTQVKFRSRCLSLLSHLTSPQSPLPQPLGSHRVSLCSPSYPETPHRPGWPQTLKEPLLLPPPPSAVFKGVCHHTWPQLFKLHLLIYLCLSVSALMLWSVCECHSTLWGSVLLSFHHRDPGNGAQVVGLGSEHLYPLTHIAGPEFNFN